MDFEWNTGHGPSDHTSPFVKITQQLGTKRKILRPSPPSAKLFSNLALPLGGFESPLKKQAHLPSADQLSNHSFFANATPAKAFRNPGFEPTPSRILQQQQKPTPFRDAPFTTPRKPFDADFFSEASGAESSPGVVGDSEDTPELRPGRQIKAFSAIKPKGEGGLFGRYGKLSHSPGRGEIRRGNKYDTTNPQRVMKRRRMDREREQILTSAHHSRRSSFDTEDEDAHSPSTSTRPAKATTAPIPQPGRFYNLMQFISTHPDLPSTLARWTQLLMNWCFGALAAYILYLFFIAIRSEIEMERLKVVDTIHSEIAKCVSDYTANRCARDTRAPALEGPCRAWEECFSRDPERVGRARVSAGTFSLIINNFFEGISWKATAIIVGSVVAVIIASNIGFSAAKQKLHDNPTAFMGNFAGQQHMQQHWDPRPAEVWFQQLPQLQAGGVPGTPARGFPTPSRGMRGERGQGNEGWGEEFRAIMPSGSPVKSPRKASRN